MAQGPREPHPTLEQVAALAGVSRATVSRVVNAASTVDPRLRERVQAAVAELHYVPHPAARALVTRRTDTLALVASEPGERVFGDPFFGQIVRGVGAEATATGLQMMLLMARSVPDVDRIERWLRSGPVDGVLLVSEHASFDPLPAALARAGIPVVIGGRPLSDLDTPYVDNDNVGGARQAAEHLLARGRHALGTVTGPADMAAGIDRLAGFREALGAAYRPAAVEAGDFTMAGGERATERLLARAPDLDGLFVASDLMALGALRALRAAGRRVPEDVAVVGFDDSPAADLADPPLTTVRQQTVLQGRAMVRMLAGLIRPEVDPVADPDLPLVGRAHRLVLPVSLVVRDSA